MMENHSHDAFELLQAKGTRRHIISTQTAKNRRGFTGLIADPYQLRLRIG
jgi:hypothetical protein